MKRMRPALAGLSILAVAGAALAFREGVTGEADLYCEKSTSTVCTHRIHYRLDPHQTNPNPCPDGSTLHTIRHDSCVALAPGSIYITILDEKR